MKALFSSQWTSTVKKTAEGVLGETIYLDTDNEFSIQVLVEPRKSFSILKATIETYRTPKGVEFCQKRELPELTGANASFEVGEALRKVNWESKLEQNLFLENTKSMIQSLVPILIEKGMGYAIDEYLRKNILNSCRFYSNLDRVKISWVDYSKDQKRFTNYFCRHQSYGVFSEDDSPGTLKLSGIFCDSFHELSLVMKINGNNKITEARAEMLRGPDDICYETPLESASIVGKELSPDLSRKEISSFLGGGNGCRHMTDMAYFLGQALNYHTLRNGK
jgi:hypothetical protein